MNKLIIDDYYPNICNTDPTKKQLIRIMLKILEDYQFLMKIIKRPLEEYNINPTVFIKLKNNIYKLSTP